MYEMENEQIEICVSQPWLLCCTSCDRIDIIIMIVKSVKAHASIGSILYTLLSCLHCATTLIRFAWTDMNCLGLGKFVCDKGRLIVMKVVCDEGRLW